MIVVLYQPQIPQNTGNIVRTCAVTGSSLVLVSPLGFSTSSRMLKRCGLDYWLGVDVKIISDLDAWLDDHLQRYAAYFFSSKATQSYTTVSYAENDALIFGSEISGLPSKYTERYAQNFVTLPMIAGARCLNLSNAVAIGLYEAWRQQGFLS